MKKSKHFRKDVILARVIFAAICIVVCVLISSLFSLLTKNDSEKPNPQKPNTQMQSELETEDTGNTELDPEIESEETQEPQTPITYAIPNTEIRLRQEPNTTSTILARIPAETKLVLVEVLDGWYKVSYEGVEGYISAQYARIESEDTPGETSSVEKDYVIMLDPGHQLTGDSTQEPNGPDSTEMKARVTSGATGVASGVKEHELTLEIALLLRTELESRGYTVLMTRETHDVNISNMERAQMANEAGADITVRIHANSFSDETVYGAETLAPSTGNPYVGDLAEDSQRLGKLIINSYCEATGMNNRHVKIDDTMTGINWCKMPVTIIELGFLSNPTDDTNMQDDEYQQKMVTGIADGIDQYFEE